MFTRKRLLSLISVLSLIIIPSFTLAAWSEPPGSPPLGNVELPINISNLSQTKDGALSVKGESPTVKGLMVGTIPSLTSFINLTQANQNLIYGAIDPSSLGSLLKLETCVAGPTCTNRLTVTNTGRMGIGISTPSYKLDVQGGQINASGGLCINADCKTAWSQVAGTNYWSPTGSNNIYNNNAGSVGIGTNDPKGSGLTAINTFGDSAIRLLGKGNFPTIKGNPIVSIDFNASKFWGSGALGSVVARIEAQSGGPSADKGQLAFWTGNPSGVIYQRMVIDFDGSVGIGRTSPAGRLDVGPNAVPSDPVTAGDLVVDTNNKYVYIGRQSTTAGDNTTFIVRDRVGGQRMKLDTNGSGDTVFNTNNSNIIFQNYVGTELMRITNTGNLGIGTFGAVAKLEVAGQIKITGGSPANGKVLTSDGTGLASWQTPSSGIGGSGTTNYLAKFTGATSLGNSTIFDNGNVGIGTTNPSVKLNVDGDISLISSANYIGTNILQSLTSTGGFPLYIKALGSGNDIILNTNSANRMTITAGGNVGIGTASPEATLSVNGTMSISPTGGSYNEGIRIHPSDINGYSGIFLGAVPGMTGSGVGQWSILRYPASSNYAFGIRYNGTDYFNITNTGVAYFNSGNVGIGKSSPRVPLDFPNTFPADIIGFYDGGANVRYGIGLTNPFGLTFYSGDRGFTFRNSNINGTDLMIITNTGNVGIGTTNPTAELTVQGKIYGGFLRSTGGMVVYGNGTYSGSFYGPGPVYIDNGVGKALSIQSGGDFYISAQVGGQGTTFWNDTGTLGIDTNAAKPGGGAWAATSDIRLKKNIKPLEGALDKMLQLQGVNFQYKDPSTQGNLAGVQMGFIAQEAEKVFPDWISENKDGYKMITTRGFEALTVEAIRTIKEENDLLKIKNQELENRIKILEEKLK